MTHTPRRKTSLSSGRGRLIGVALKLSCAVLLLGGAALTQNEACNGAAALGAACAEPVVASNDPMLALTTAAVSNEGMKTVVTPVRVGLLPVPHTLDAVRSTPIATATDFDAAMAPVNGDSSMLALLIAALGVVSYVAHRRSGR